MVNCWHKIHLNLILIQWNGKDEAGYLLEDKVTLEDATNPLECTKQATSPAPNVVIYRCLDGNEAVDLLTNKSRTVRFQHKGGRSVSICEVKIYANPSKFNFIFNRFKV